MMISPQPQIFQNAVLRSLNGDCIERLRLRPVKLEAERRIAGPDDAHRWLLFIEAGSVALGVPLRDGSVIDTGLLGNRSIVSLTALLGTRESLYRATVRAPGHGFICSVDSAIEEFGRPGQFRDLVLSCLHAQLMQVSQLAACNLRHDVQQRLCRWMLQCQNEAPSRQIYATQEILAEALGVRRTTVTGTMLQLRTEGLIAYSRGTIRLLDQAALEARACECYKTIRDSSSVTKLSQRAPGNRVAPQLAVVPKRGAQPFMSAF